MATAMVASPAAVPPAAEAKPYHSDVLKLLLNLNPMKNNDTQKKINKFFMNLTAAKLVFIVWLPKGTQKGIINVMGEAVLNPYLDFQQDIPIVDDGSEEQLVPSRQGVKDKGLDAALSKIIPQFPKDLPKIPITLYDSVNSIWGLACFSGCSRDFYQQQPKVKECFRYLSGFLISAFNVWFQQSRQIMYKRLLEFGEKILLPLEGDDLKGSLQKCCEQMKKFIGAEHVSVFMLSPDNKELLAKVFKGKDNLKDVKINIENSISERILEDGTPFILHENKSHKYFFDIIEEFYQKPVKNMLTFPIKGKDNESVGIVIMINKPYSFTECDADAAKNLSIYFSLAVLHTVIYKRMYQSETRVIIAIDMLTHHLGVTDTQVQQMVEWKQHPEYARMADLKWIARDVPVETTTALTVYMFESLGYLKTFRILKTTLCRFVLLTRRYYRDVAYHNWIHGFGVAHQIYAFLKSCDLVEKSCITELEGLALLTAAVCHDIDHRGTTNAFQDLVKSSLALLYGADGSIMEHHHFCQAMSIMNTDGCNIFEDMDNVAYRRVLELILEVIIATDIGIHLRFRSQQKKVLENYDADILHHRQHLCACLITAADLNDQVKGWKNSRDSAIMLYEEFFHQGDLEKEMTLTPAAMLDRQQADIPRFQVNFLNEICLPVYISLRHVSAEINVCVNLLDDNIDCWKKTEQWMNRFAYHGATLNALTDTALESYINENMEQHRRSKLDRASSTKDRFSTLVSN